MWLGFDPKARSQLLILINMNKGHEEHVFGQISTVKMNCARREEKDTCSYSLRGYKNRLIILNGILECYWFIIPISKSYAECLKLHINSSSSCAIGPRRLVSAIPRKTKLWIILQLKSRYKTVLFTIFVPNLRPKSIQFQSNKKIIKLDPKFEIMKSVKN